MSILQDVLNKRFLYLCSNGAVNELSTLLISYNPSFEILHEGASNCIVYQRSNTLNFLIENFKSFDPHYNKNMFFEICLSSSNLIKKKNLLNKLIKSEKFNGANIEEILYNYSINRKFLNDNFFKNLQNLPIFKFLSNEIQIMISKKPDILIKDVLKLLKIKITSKYF
jgi:hypothetical protein